MPPVETAQAVADQMDRGRPVTVSVVPFSSASGVEEAWLGKAIADLLSRKLAEAPTFAVLDRERLHDFLDELELQDSGFFGEEDAGRLGRVAKLDQVVYGNFHNKDGHLSLNLLLVDLATQEGVLTAQVEGSLDDLQELVSELALKVLSLEGLSASQELYQRIRYSATHSLPATEHFYRALDHLDRGRPEEAFGAFHAASQQDPSFLEARLWMGRTLQALGRDDLAIAAYDELGKLPGRQVEQLDALFLKAGLLEADNPERAASGYRELMSHRQATPHSLEAAYRLGVLLTRQGDAAGAYQAFAFVDAVRASLQARRGPGAATRAPLTSDYLAAALLEDARLMLEPAASGKTEAQVSEEAAPGPVLRRSRLLDWGHALSLYQDAVLRMASLLPELPPETLEADGWSPPRGVYFLSPESPSIAEANFRAQASLFHEEDYGPNWREKFYVIALPKGYVATGVEMELSGRQLKRSQGTSYAMRLLPFPWPPNYHNAWLGVIYGQARTPSTLRKEIFFHGEARSALAVQFIENHSEIHGWRLKVKLRRQEALTRPDLPPHDITSRIGADRFWEGEKVGHLPMELGSVASPALPLFAYLQHPRRSLALANSYLGGLDLVTVSGTLGGQATDLLWSHSDDGVDWSLPEPLPINSVSEDYDPRLLPAEDGGLRLFWLSDRRGRGWELWTSYKARDGLSWDGPTRVPLGEEQIAMALPEGMTSVTLPDYAVTQDSRGRWLLAFSGVGTKDISFLGSNDGVDWYALADVTAPEVIRSLVLIENRAGRFVFGGKLQGGSFQLWRSNNLSDWQPVTTRGPEQEDNNFSRADYPSNLFAEPSGDLLLLTSDAIFGLRYARVNPDQGRLELDLVKDAALEDYAVTALGDGSYLVALAQGDGIELRRYRRFQSPDNGVNPPAGRIYTEVETDASNNRWHRTFARHRTIRPDVTAIAVEEDGRVWWGIESGIMSVNRSDFFSQEVAEGFFAHAVSDIVPCGDRVYFAAPRAPRDRVALARVTGSVTTTLGRRTAYATEAISLPAFEGQITALTCFNPQGSGRASLVLGTSGGEMLALHRHEPLWRTSVGRSAAVTAIAADRGSLFAGTAEGRVYHLTGDGLVPAAAPPGEGAISAMTFDAKGRLWLAKENEGLWVAEPAGWRQLADPSSDFPYRSIAALHADPKNGVWVTPSPESLSVGLLQVTDQGIRYFNPPSRRLAKPLGIDVAANGDIWIATALHGFYRLERAVP